MTEEITDGPQRVVLLHGFTQSAASWGRLAERPGAYALDLPGHGGAVSEPCGFGEGVKALARRGGRGVWVGYSMGGRYALHVALRYPERVRALMLIGAHPGIEDEAAREARLRADRARAEQVESMAVEDFLEEWLSQPLFGGLDEKARGIPARTVNTPAGLARALREGSTGLQAPLWERLGSLAMPVCYVAGADDGKYASVGRRFVEAVGPNARLELAPGCGHAVPFEDPLLFGRLLDRWLAELPRAE